MNLKHNHEAGNKPGVLAGIIGLSAVVGAAVTALLTPKNGKEVRTDIRNKVTDTKSQLQHMAHEQKMSGETPKDIIAEKTPAPAKRAAAKAKPAATRAESVAKKPATRVKTTTKKAAGKATDITNR